MADVSVISSMATRRVLDDLAVAFKRSGSDSASVLSIGGVDAAKRIRAGEVFDVAVLSEDALRALAKDGLVVADSIAAFTRSPTAVAVRAGTDGVAPADADAIRRLLGSARRVGVSTGPSGKAVRTLLTTWGFGEPACQLVEAPPGVPVARLLQGGDVDLGFQQLSELLGESGIDILGPVPAEVLPVTVFAMARCAMAADPAAAARLLGYLASPQTAATKELHGMQPG